MLTRLATTAIGGLAALAALLLIREMRAEAKREEEAAPPLIIIHGEPRYDTPPADPQPERNRLMVMPVQRYEEGIF